MSLYGALNIGVAGLQANSMALSATSSNIANVNTVGYKEARASFSTILNASTGVISGTPTTAGSFTVAVSVTDSEGTSVNGNVTITVTAPATP